MKSENRINDNKKSLFLNNFKQEISCRINLKLLLLYFFVWLFLIPNIPIRRAIDVNNNAMNKTETLLIYFDNNKLPPNANGTIVNNIALDIAYGYIRFCVFIVSAKAANVNGKTAYPIPKKTRPRKNNNIFTFVLTINKKKPMLNEIRLKHITFFVPIRSETNPIIGENIIKVGDNE